MQRHYCRCLNITINVQMEICMIPGKELFKDCDDDAKSSDNFFQNELIEVQLAMSGIEKEQHMLVNERVCGDWLVTACMNCLTDIYTVHGVKGVERIFIANNLLTNTDTICKMKRSDDFSCAFKILFISNGVMNGGMKGKPTTPVSPFSRSKELFDTTQIIENFVKKFLRKEEEEMNERIRVFTVNQQVGLHDLRAKTEREHERMLKLVCKQDDVNGDNLLESFNDCHFGEPSDLERRDSCTSLPSFKVSQSRHNQYNKRSKSSSSANNPNYQQLFGINTSMAQSLPADHFMGMQKHVLVEHGSWGHESLHGSMSSELMDPHNNSMEGASSKKKCSFSDDEGNLDLDQMQSQDARDNSRGSSQGSSGLGNQMGSDSSLNFSMTSQHRNQSKIRTKDDPLFGMDGFHENQRNAEPFYESDDESSGEATSLESSGGFSIPSHRHHGSSHHSRHDRVYATSVPVGIPMKMRKQFQGFQDDESDEEDRKAPPPENMAESIRNMANSMTGNSNSVFGELPRSRFHTMHK